MCLVGQEGESQVFQMEHKTDYQKVQDKFWDAVDSMAPENLMVSVQVVLWYDECVQVVLWCD